MNLPNRLTLARILLVPVYLLLIAFGGEACRIPAALVFALAAATDWLDGRIARKHNLITNMGKFLDPIADKLLVVLSLVLLTALQEISPWLTLVIIAREFLVSGLRLVAVSEGLVLAAGPLGKVKTVLQMALVLAATLRLGLVTGLLSWLAGLLTLWSGLDYLLKNRSVLKEANHP